MNDPQDKPLPKNRPASTPDEPRKTQNEPRKTLFERQDIMNLLEAYVHEVGQHLPRKGRADLEAEIHSLIADTLDARAAETGRPVDEALTVEVLKEFGSPQKMAANYTAPRYLVGPRLYPFFLMVIKIVASVLVVLGLIKLGFDIGQQGDSIRRIVEITGQNFVDLATSLLAALGNIVFVFAILEYFLKADPLEEKDWNPRDLKTVEETDKVNPFFMVLGIVFHALLILVFNFYPQFVGIIGFTENGPQFAALLSDAFFAYLPWLTALWALNIALCAVLLGRGRHTLATQLFEVAVSIATIVLLLIMAAGAPIIHLTVATLGVELVEGLQPLLPQLYTGVRSLLIIIALLEGLDVVKFLWKRITRKGAPIAQVTLSR
jgi:hypothetical protein